MNTSFSASDLKTIQHSKRANLYYLEHCRVLVNGGRVEYVTEAGNQSTYWNIPIANTTTLLLGTGTSITQAAMRELAKAGVMVGFCGGGGTPLFSRRPGLHCRIGSSEKWQRGQRGAVGLHCRIGSSEMAIRRADEHGLLHCRIGSSERKPLHAC